MNGFALDLIHQRLVEVEILAALAQPLGTLVKSLRHVGHLLLNAIHALLLDALLIVLETLQLAVLFFRPNETFLETCVVHRIYNVVTVLFCDIDTASTAKLLHELLFGFLDLCGRNASHLVPATTSKRI